MLDLVPGARTVLDPFCGSGALSFIKMPSECEQLGLADWLFIRLVLTAGAVMIEALAQATWMHASLNILNDPSHPVLFGSSFHTLKTALNQNHAS